MAESRDDPAGSPPNRELHHFPYKKVRVPAWYSFEFTLKAVRAAINVWSPLRIAADGESL